MRPERTAAEGLGNPITILNYTTLYPNSEEPNHGVFVENRLRHVVATGRVKARVIAPVPWFPTTNSLFGRYAAQARVPALETRNGLAVAHPRYVVLPKIGMSITPAALFAATVSLARQYLAQSDFDLIDAHYFYPDGVAAILLGKVLGKPVVITARGTDVNYIPRFAVARRMIQYAAKHAAGIIAVSQALKTALVELGVRPESVTVLRNGVDLDLFRPVERTRERASLGLTGRTLLSVGHLIERKGHDIVISALPRLPDFSLLIAGDGPERSRLQAHAQQLGVAHRVRFLGSVAHENLHKVYAVADALILASSREGWPNVLLEAMACGTPVIATSIWGNPEIVSRPEAGILMQSRTPEAAADAVKILFGQLPDRAATRRFAEQFSWDASSAGQIRMFESITAARRQTSN